MIFFACNYDVVYNWKIKDKRIKIKVGHLQTIINIFHQWIFRIYFVMF
jgi:hypothetical protein